MLRESAKSYYLLLWVSSFLVFGVLTSLMASPQAQLWLSALLLLPAVLSFQPKVFLSLSFITVYTIAMERYLPHELARAILPKPTAAVVSFYFLLGLANASMPQQLRPLIQKILKHMIPVIGCALIASTAGTGLLSLLIYSPIVFLFFVEFNRLSQASSDQEEGPKILLIWHWTTIITVISVVLACGWLINYPYLLNWDEGYYLNVAMGFKEYGTTYVHMWRLPEDTSLIFGGGQGYGALLYLLFLKYTQVSLPYARIFSYFFLLLSLPLCFLYTRRLFSEHVNPEVANKIAWWSIPVSVASFSFVPYLSGRIDSYAVCAYYLVLLVFFTIRRSNSLLPHFLFGLVSVAAAEVHIYGLIYVFTIGVWYLFEACTEYAAHRGASSGKKNLARNHCLAYLSGSGLSSCAYLYLHLFRGGEAQRLIMKGCANCIANPLHREAVRVLHFINNSGIDFLAVALVIISLTTATLAERKTFRDPLLLLAAAYFGFALGVPPHYEQHLVPLIVPLLAGAVTLLTKTPVEAKRLYPGSLLAFTLIMMMLESAGQLHAVISKEQSVIVNQSHIRCVKALTHPGEVVAGPGPHFAFLPDYVNYLNAGTNPTLLAPLREETPEALITREDPEIIITTDYGPDKGQALFRSYAQDPTNGYAEIDKDFFVKEKFRNESLELCEMKPKDLAPS